MTKFDSFKQYKAELERIERQIAEEENPYHRQHIAEFSNMIDDRIRAVVPQMIDEQQKDIRLNIQTYMNGKRVTSSADIVNGVKDIVFNALKGIGRGR